MLDDVESRVGPWSPVDAGLAHRATSVAVEVAARLSDPDTIVAALDRAATQTRFPEILHWDPISVAQGDSGMAVLYGYLDRCQAGGGWDRIGHQFLSRAVAAAGAREGILHSLFSGYSGMALAAGTLSHGGSRYRRLREQLDAEVIGQVLTAVGELRREPSGAPVWSFDVISGLSGSGAYLLTRRGDSIAAGHAVVASLEALVRICSVPGDLPGWYTPVRYMDGPMAALYPFGNLNCGLAHGVPGVLAFLSLAWLEGARVAGQEQAIRRVAAWLGEHRSDDGWGPNWPVAVGLSAAGTAGSAEGEPARSAWCYGAPGVARAIWLAARATGDPAPAELAIEAMRGVFRRPVPERLIDSPTFCHGVAGLLQTTLRFHHETGLPDFAEAVGGLVAQLLDAYEEDRPVGFYSIEPGGAKVDQPGLLDGAAGVALTLLAAGGTQEPTWDRLFLLS